jgi:signal transduction histidine kinase/ActR/RegA family two-component response regulator
MTRMMDSSALQEFQLESAIDRNPLIVGRDALLLEVLAQMNGTHLDAHSGSSCALIVEDRQVLGILTDRDIVHLAGKALILTDLRIADVMIQPVITLHEDAFTDLAIAIDILCENDISYLPLIDRDDRLIGLLTRESLQQRCHPNEQWRNISSLKQELVNLRRAEEVLIQSNQELARSTRLKDEFLANMSHELRTPLNAIFGMTEGLQEGIFGIASSAQIQAIQTIERSSSHLLELIDDILDLAKIGAGQIQLECSPTNICELCDSSLSFIKQQAKQKGIRLHLELPPRIPNISIDERRIRQVLINLLNNAVKFTPIDGTISLVVTIEADNTTGTWIRLVVNDSGIGIDRVDIDKLFQPFTQLDTALNRQYNGTGLGLALVKGIVELHGGSVQVRSEIGIGSQFIVDLPIPQSKRDANGTIVPQFFEFSQPVFTSMPRPIDPASARSCKILLAEDNEANTSSISSYLKAKGYQIILAKNGLEAVKMASAQIPDLILMDIQMPKMDGLEAIRYIRAHPQLTTVPIVALTALAMSGDREKCISAGANDYLAKPVKLKQLANSIQQLLSIKSLEVES